MEYIWLSGTKEEIEEMKEALRANGFTFSQGSFIKSGDAVGPGKYSSALKNFCPTTVATPQPRPWDAVLGGRK
jgi:hypothetical protein